MRFTFRQLEYFRSTAELGSFSAAASQLFVSATAVTSAISDLEEVLGTQLFVRRKSHGVTLTPSGQHLLNDARQLLLNAEEMERSMHSRDGILHGPIVVGCYSTLAPTVLPALISGFEALHPKVILNVAEGSNDELLPMMDVGKLDVLITYRINLPPGLAEAELLHTAVHALLPANHPLAGEAAVWLRDLQDEPLIMLDLPPSGRHALDMLHGVGIRPRIRHSTRNFELVRSMVARGLGYSLLVQRPWIEHSYEGLPLITRPILPDIHRETVVMVWPEHIQCNPRLQALIDFARRTVKLSQAWPVS
ncbi:LysR family transcriptional regulator [Bordetella sp. J329]|jgi:DNA-binding transcriptional LysR family regulator|uniref:LysR family transcriptional regulator n=1 Tax=Kerstersia gyiorum TaxID=206506 RepID=UPI000FDC768B|nr:LysR family transcriptional regulator [Kerstersia gyiorum]AZV94161.1 LysR family transcriptional regulator [Bordetella sp. J329]MCH4270710.1 LysR family transcriptional regulator [Kerstersia gyiorum]MCI1229538.1 LysR family transcriptional regulator [Kerstersia gyiorum]